MIAPQCLLVAAVAAVALSVPVTQEEYARYIAQQQTQRLEEKPEKAAPQPRRPAGVYQVQQAAAYQAPQEAAFEPAPAAYQPQPQAYSAQPPSYQSPLQAYRLPEEYQQPEQPYQQTAVRARAPRPKASYKPPKQPSNRPETPEDEENDNNPNAQYQFSFDISDDESTNYHNRKEQRDGEKISGSYSVVDSDGFIRTVKYTADPLEGFKAEVSREPTNIQVKIPTPAPQTEAPAHQYRFPERKAPPQYISVQASEPESAEQPAEPISGYYRPAPQQIKARPAAVHRFAAPGPAPKAGSKAVALGYAAGPTNSPVIYQAYQQ